MKKILASLMLAIAVFAGNAAAQVRSCGFDFNQLAVTGGKGALSSGLDITGTLKTCDEKQELELTYEQQQAWFVWRWDLPTKQFGEFDIAATGGHFNNAPMAGPQLIWKINKNLSMLQWFAVSAGDPGHPEWNVKFLNHFAGMYYSRDIGNTTIVASYALLKFRADPWKQLPGAAITQKFGRDLKFKWIAGMDYDLTEREPLFRFGGSFSKKKDVMKASE